MERLIDLIVGKWPELVIILIVVLIVWMVAKFYFKRFVPMENKINDVPCNSPKGHCKGIDIIESDIKEIKSGMQNIKEYIVKQDPYAAYDLFVKGSPFKLTDKGIFLLEVSGGKKCIDDNIDFFDKEIQLLNPKVALDVESIALSVLDRNTNSDFFNDIKNFVFNASKIITDKSGNKMEFNDYITLIQVLQVMSIYLRDNYFERHPHYLNAINL